MKSTVKECLKLVPRDEVSEIEWISNSISNQRKNVQKEYNIQWCTFCIMGELLAHKNCKILKYNWLMIHLDRYNNILTHNYYANGES